MEQHFGFGICMLTMWNYGTDEGLSAIEQQSYSMAYCLLGSEKSTVKERGIEGYFISEDKLDIKLPENVEYVFSWRRK